MSPIRIVTLNVWNRFGPWEARLAGIRAGLAKLSPDLVGLQEVVRTDEGDRLDQAAVIADGLGYHVALGFWPAGHGYGNAVLSRWPILRAEVIALPDGGTDERRNLLFAEADSPYGKIPFFVTHLNWKLHHGHVRELQVLAVADAVRSIAPVSNAPGSFPPILVGDFNAEPESDEIRFLRGYTSLGGRKRVYYADAFAVAGDGSPGYTYARRNPFAALVREPNRRLDYIFVRGPDDRYRGEPLEAALCFDEPVAGVYLSDHFGVTATISTG
jgi:endonuclease/exonuclease/phosphatase family metal-dependent hydrolase